MKSVLLIFVPLAPLLASLAVLIAGRKFPRAIAPLALAGTAASLVAAVTIPGPETAAQAVWFRTAGRELTAGLRFDGLGSFMAVLVSGVSVPVVLYSIGYIESRERPRFFSQLLFFIGSMLVLVLADSFLLLFAAWEAVGTASFLLIGFWYERDEARTAARNAFILTRLGDMGMLLAWLFVLNMVGTTDMRIFEQEIAAIPSHTLTLLALLFLSAAIGKSAQLPLTAWLPQAMAGPTPVSALIHSATMVAAGVYLLLRLTPLFAAAPGVLTAVAWVGGLTALFGALVAAVQTDLKRVLAWSTVSQLGEMMLAAGLGAPLAAALHLATQAAFKSTLFLAAGAVDHATGTRDIRNARGLGRSMPLTALVFGAAGLALAGVPPFSGFWSGEAILGRASEASPFLGLFLTALLFLAGLYISRAFFAVFLPAGTDVSEPRVHKTGWSMKAGMALLAIPAVFAGWFLSGRLERVLSFSSVLHPSIGWTAASVAASLLGILAGFLIVRTRGPEAAPGPFPQRLENALLLTTNAGGRAVAALAKNYDRLEKELDGIARLAAEAGLRLGMATMRAEAVLDLGSRNTGLFGLRLASVSGISEDRGFSDSLDRFAALLGRAGGRLRELQTGKIFLYTLGLFLWILIAGIAGLIVWWIL